MFITVEQNGRKIKSRAWCFEAMCLIDDKRDRNVYEACIGAADYLFDGRADLSECGYETELRVCAELFEQYKKDVYESAKMPNRPSGGESRHITHLRELYSVLFELWGIMPSDVARQEPRLLFAALTPRDAEPQISAGVKSLYGL